MGSDIQGVTVPTLEDTAVDADGQGAVIDNAKACLNEAVKHHASGDFNAAVPFYIRAVTLAPNDPDVLHATGIALGQSGHAREAVKHLTAALHFGKNDPDVWNALGMAFVELRVLGNAERCFRQVVQRNPKSATGWVNFGNFAYAAGQPDLGARRFDQAVSFRAAFVDDRFVQGMVWLLRGQWRLGWKAYEARKQIGNWRIRNHQQKGLKAPELTREQIKRGMRILVEAEQGQGDAVIAARFIQPFADLYGVEVVVQSHNALKDMLEQALPAFEVVDRQTIPAADGWVPMLSLPYFIGLSSPKHVPPPIKPFGQTWVRERRTGERLRVFVHPRGNANHSYDFDRSLPGDATWAPIADLPNVEVVRADFAPVAEAGGAMLAAEPSWRDTVDKLLTCDRCLTVDTSVAHVAGSLGIPTDLMVPTMPEWRWGFKDTTVWYPSVKLWHRKTTFAWDEMVGKIAESYAQM